MNYTLIIPAAGQGKRMGAGKNKLFLEVNNEPIIVHTLKQFQQDALCEEIVLVINGEEEATFSSFLASYGLHKKIVFVQGGAERQESVYNGIVSVHQAEYIVVHDGARPFVTSKLTHEVLQGAVENGAAICAVPVKDTIKRVHNGLVVETVERSSLWSVQTPQAFKASLLREAHEQARKDGFLGTDDASLVEQLGKNVKVMMGDYCNIKVTTPEDLILAESFLKKR